jgi:DnaJ-class molecular chaperone
MTTKETKIVTCPDCGGTGEAWDYIYALHQSVLDICARCQGRGKLEVAKDAEVKASAD